MPGDITDGKDKDEEESNLEKKLKDLNNTPDENLEEEVKEYRIMETLERVKPSDLSITYNVDHTIVTIFKRLKFLVYFLDCRFQSW